MAIPFVSFYKVADFVTQQIRYCPFKTQTATTGTQPPLVASQFNSLNIIKEKNILLDICKNRLPEAILTNTQNV